MRRRAARLVLLTVAAGLLVVPARTWLQKRATELAYRFVEEHEPIARSLECSCGCKDSGHSTLADCFLFSDQAKTRNPHGAT